MTFVRPIRLQGTDTHITLNTESSFSGHWEGREVREHKGD